MIKTKVAFLGERLLSSQSEQSNLKSTSIQKAFIGLKKASPPQKPRLF